MHQNQICCCVDEGEATLNAVALIARLCKALAAGSVALLT
jgi:hypothetical protein